MTFHMGDPFGTNFLVYLIVATIVGIIAKAISICYSYYAWYHSMGVGRRFGWGWRQFLRDNGLIWPHVAWQGISLGGSIITGIVGAWFMTQIIVLPGFGHIGDINVAGVPIIRVVIGTLILVAVWHRLFPVLFLYAALWVRHLFYGNDPNTPYP